IDLPPFAHGRHRDLEFWAYDQPTDYYRRHLVIHEATHCFMSTGGFVPPPWYMEGMAELFATHDRSSAGAWRFGLMPGGPTGFEGLRRIPLIRQAIREGQARSTKSIREMTAQD